MLNVLSLFSGIGAFEKALTNLDIPYNLLAYCEIDKYASKAYSVIHNVSEEKNLKDVTKIDFFDFSDDVDLITYGFPCQDISLVGNQKGFVDENGNRTRSGLFFEALRIIDNYKPKFAIAENVKALTSKRFSNEFKTVLDSLEEIGYVNYWQVLNSKDYGIPQNRERVFIISIRKDIDKGFTFPKAKPLRLQLKDLLEDNIDDNYIIDEKYYLSEKMIKYISAVGTANFKNSDCKINLDIARPLTTGQNKRAGTTNYISRDVGREFNLNEENVKPLRVRKLTPSECFRLMGFTFKDCRKVCNEGISNTQLYKQAGNSIVVNVLEAIFLSLGEYYDEFKKAG